MTRFAVVLALRLCAAPLLAAARIRCSSDPPNWRRPRGKGELIAWLIS